MKYFYLFTIATSLLLIFLPGCKDDGPCVPEVLSADFRIYKSNERCGDLGLPWEASFGVRISFDHYVYCDSECREKRIFYLEGATYLKHVNGTVDTLHSPHRAAFCSTGANEDSIYPSVTYESELGQPDPYNFALGDTLYFELSNPVMCEVDEYGHCKEDGWMIPVDLPDHTFEYILSPADFDCD